MSVRILIGDCRDRLRGLPDESVHCIVSSPTDVATINAPLGKPGRHSWGEPLRFPYKTARSCIVCGIVKVTRHEAGVRPWLEFYRDGERIECERTPECTAA